MAFKQRIRFTGRAIGTALRPYTSGVYASWVGRLGFMFFGMIAVPHRGSADHGPAAQAPQLGPNDIASVFHVRKSENRNQVHYGMHLDQRCRPVGESPVFAYWQEHEQGPDVTLPLTTFEQRAYGIYRQQVSLLQSRAGRVEVVLEAARRRLITVESYRDDRYHCRARALTRIGNEKRAQLHHIYVKIGTLKHVEYVLLRGESLGGRAVQERIER